MKTFSLFLALLPLAISSCRSPDRQHAQLLEDPFLSPAELEQRGQQWVAKLKNDGCVDYDRSVGFPTAPYKLSTIDTAPRVEKVCLNLDGRIEQFVLTVVSIEEHRPTLFEEKVELVHMWAHGNNPNVIDSATRQVLWSLKDSSNRFAGAYGNGLLTVRHPDGHLELFWPVKYWWSKKVEIFHTWQADAGWSEPVPLIAGGGTKREEGIVTLRGTFAPGGLRIDVEGTGKPTDSFQVDSVGAWRKL